MLHTEHTAVKPHARVATSVCALTFDFVLLRASFREYRHFLHEGAKVDTVGVGWVVEPEHLR